LSEENITEVLDAIQLGLDIIGLIPVIGEVADALSGIISLGRGDVLGASLSLAAMAVFVGGAAGAAKLARRTANAVESVDTAADATKSLVQEVRHLGDIEQATTKAVDQAFVNIDSALKSGKITESQVLNLLQTVQKDYPGADLSQIVRVAKEAGAKGADNLLQLGGSLLRNDNLLAKNLGGRIPGYTPHHLIPIAEAPKHDVMKRAAELGYNINRGRNGINLPNTPELAMEAILPYHPPRGNHSSAYRGPVNDRLKELQDGFDAGIVTEANLLEEIGKVEDSIRADLLNGTLRLNSRYGWYVSP